MDSLNDNQFLKVSNNTISGKEFLLFCGKKENVLTKKEKGKLDVELN